MAEIKLRKNVNLLKMEIDPVVRKIYTEAGDLSGEIDIADVIEAISGTTTDEIIESFIMQSFYLTLGVTNVDVLDYVDRYLAKVNEYKQKAHEILEK